MTQLPPHHHTDRLIRHIERQIRQIGTVLPVITSFLEFIVATQADLMAQIQQLNQAVVADQASDQAVVDQLDQIIKDLQASGDTSAAIAALQDVQAQIKTVSTSTTPPAP